MRERGRREREGEGDGERGRGEGKRGDGKTKGTNLVLVVEPRHHHTLMEDVLPSLILFAPSFVEEVLRCMGVRRRVACALRAVCVAGGAACVA